MGLGDNTRPQVAKPVIKVELSEKNKRIRLVAVILLIVIAAVSFTVVVKELLGHSGGWQTISPKEDVFGFTDEIAISYELGASGLTVMEENAAIAEIYTAVAKEMQYLFDTEAVKDGKVNLAYLSQNVGASVTVDERLYKALDLMLANGSRKLYQKPILDMYRALFNSENSVAAKMLDPYYSAEILEKFNTVNAYILSEDHVSLELLGENRVTLRVSDEYAAYAEQNGFVGYLDFGIYRNAFCVDTLADALIGAGYTHGSVASFDGYARSLDDRDVEYALNINDMYNGGLYTAAKMKFKGRIATVQYRDYPMSEAEFLHYYSYDEGAAHIYISESDGLYRSSVDTMYAYSYGKSCAEIALFASDLYISDSIDYNLISELVGNGVDIVFADDSACIRYTEQDRAIVELHNGETLSYTKELID